MPVWAWVAVLFVGMTISYFCGYKLGLVESDECPSQKAWIEVRKYSIDKQSEVNKYGIDKDHEFNLELMERGAFDHPIEDEEDVEQESKE